MLNSQQCDVGFFGIPEKRYQKITPKFIMMVSFDCQFDVIWIHLGDVTGTVCVVYSGDLSENEDLPWCGWYNPVNLSLGWGKKESEVSHTSLFTFSHFLTGHDESCFVPNTISPSWLIWSPQTGNQDKLSCP